MINGVGAVAITKLDVLSHFDKIKVCVGYKLDGQTLKSFPTDVERLSKVTPIYEELDGWMEDITECKSYSDLPAKTKEYLDYIAGQSGIKLDIISVGPKRRQTIFVNS